MKFFTAIYENLVDCTMKDLTTSTASVFPSPSALNFGYQGGFPGSTIIEVSCFGYYWHSLLYYIFRCLFFSMINQTSMR